MNFRGSGHPRSLVDQELLHRLASLEVAASPQTGLLGIQGKLQRDIRLYAEHNQQDMFTMFGLEGTASLTVDPNLFRERQRTEAKARAFLRLCNINGAALDRLGRYETSIWRQVVKVLFLLEGISRPHSSSLVGMRNEAN